MFDGRLSIGPDPAEEQSLWLQAEAAAKLQRQFLASAIMMGEESDHAEQVLAAVSLVGSLPDMTAAAFLLHPSVRYWLQASRRTTSAEHRAHRHRVIDELSSLVWPLATLSRLGGVTWRVVADERGGIRMPPFGSYLELSDAHASQPILISSRRDEIELRTSEGELLGALMWEEADDGCPAIRAIRGGVQEVYFQRLFGGNTMIDSRDPFLRVKLTGTNQRKNGTDFFAVSADLYDDSLPVPHIADAAALIEEVWPEIAQDIGIFTHVIVPIWLPKAQRGAFTVSSRQGAIFVGEGNCDDVAEMILHENAHVKLRQIQLIDTLLRDPLDETIKIAVPWRPDPRPVPGVIEGLFVFSHVAEFHLKREPRSAELDSRTERLVAHLVAAYEAVVDCADLTEAGEEFISEIGDWIRSLADRVNCPAAGVAARLSSTGKEPVVVPD